MCCWRMCLRNVSSGFKVSSANVSSECVVSVSASSGFKVSSANVSSECVISVCVSSGSFLFSACLSPDLAGGRRNASSESVVSASSKVAPPSAATLYIKVKFFSNSEIVHFGVSDKRCKIRK